MSKFTFTQYKQKQTTQTMDKNTNKAELTRWLQDNYKAVDLLEEVDEKIDDYIDKEDIEEHGSREEAYIEVGRGGAHADVVNEVYHHAQSYYVGDDLPWDLFEEAFKDAFEEGENLITGME